MRTRLLFATASLFLLTALPAEAYGDRRDRQAYGYNLKQACNYGDRRACFQLGEIVGQRREARRQRDWDRSDYRRPLPYGWNQPRWNQPQPGFSWRFESR